SPKRASYFPIWENTEPLQTSIVIQENHHIEPLIDQEMSKKNIFGEEGIKKLQALAEEIDTCMFCTGLSSRPIEVSPMTVQEVDEEGDFLFIGSKESEKYHNLMENSAVQLLYSDNDNYRYLSVYGSADMIEDQGRVDKYWSVIMEGWF